MLRVAHYNIFRGGEDRLNVIGDILQQINPDICGILEAVDWHKKNKELSVFFKKKGFNFLKISKANSRHNIAIISKFPVKIKSYKQGFRHVVVKVSLKEKKYNEFSFFFVHLSHVSEKDRLKEVKNLIDIINNKPCIIMGDLNSLSDVDPYGEEILNKFKKLNITKFGKEKLTFSVIKKLKKLRFIDVAEYLGKSFITSVPTPFNKDPYHAVPIRIDYAFVSRELISYIKNQNILKNKKSNLGSDHYPLFIDIEKKKGTASSCS